jgi:hypothetical protein
MTHKIKDHRLYRILIFGLLLGACSNKEQAHPVADTAATKNAVERLEGKTMRTFKGPAEILGDTTKNRRSYLKKKE